VKPDQFLNLKKNRSPVKIDQFLKEEVAHETIPIFKKDRSPMKIHHFVKRG